METSKLRHFCCLCNTSEQADNLLIVGASGAVCAGCVELARAEIAARGLRCGVAVPLAPNGLSEAQRREVDQRVTVQCQAQLRRLLGHLRAVGL